MKWLFSLPFHLPSLFLQLSSRLSETTREGKHEETWLQTEDVFENWEIGEQKVYSCERGNGQQNEMGRTFNLSEKKANPDGYACQSRVRHDRRASLAATFGHHAPKLCLEPFPSTTNSLPVLAVF